MTHLGREALIVLAEDMTADNPHLHTCARCRDEVAALRVVLARVAAADDVPEPSPLFWEHFTARVNAAIDAGQPVATPWWRRWQGWAYATAACAAMVVAVLAVRPEVPAPVSGVGPTLTVAATETGADSLPLAADEQWEWVVGAAVTEAESDAAFDASLVPAAADIAVQDLDGDERSALASLLRAELAGRVPTAEM